MAIRAVLIDVGGPILDEDHEYVAWDEFLISLLREEEIEIEEEFSQLVLAAIRRCDRNPRLSVLWELVRPDVARFRRLRDAFRGFQRRHLAGGYVPRLRPGAKEALEGLAARYTLALAGNQPAKVKEFLAAQGILDHFDFSLVSEELGVRKPDPLFFQVILDSLRVEPQEAIMVGDRLDHDVYPTKLLGMRAIRVLVGPYAQQGPQTPLHEPDITISSMAELPEAVERLR